MYAVFCSLLFDCRNEMSHEVDQLLAQLRDLEL